jgi:outer membrane protein assembly factor BamB
MTRNNVSKFTAANRHQLVTVIGMLSFVLLGIHNLTADDWPQWRGPNRDGLSRETGLLKEWPEEGPSLVWQVKNLGRGFSTPAVVGGRLYLMANAGMDEFVRCLDVKDGAEIWSTRIGKVGNPDQKPPYAAARSTPTVEGNVLYALGSDGDVASLETTTGKIRWHRSLRADFAGKPGTWAYAESPLIDGDVLVCTPGGNDATLLALNKTTGQVVWKCALPEGDDAAYASAIVIEAGGARQYVQLLQKGLVSVNVKSGKLLWRYAKPVSVFDANIPTPLADGGIIYVASAGTGGGAVKVKAKDANIKADQLYFEPKLPTAIGGTVKIGGFLYGTTAEAMMCVEFATGKVKWQDRALGAASMCYADKRLYLHGENGAVALVEPSSESYSERGRFTPPDQPKHTNEKAWAYPVVANGRLYVRDLGTLWCFDIKAP